MLTECTQNYPIIVLQDVTYNEIKHIVHYMYYGEVYITYDRKEAFLSAGKFLQIRGLSDDPKTRMNEKQPWKASTIAPPSPIQKTVEPKHISSQMGYHSDCSLSGTTSPPNSGKRRCTDQRNASELNSSFHSNNATCSFDTLNKFQSAPSVDKIVPNASIASPSNVTMPLPIVPSVPFYITRVPQDTNLESSVPTSPLYSSFNDKGTSNFVLAPKSEKRRCTAQGKTYEFDLSFHPNNVPNSFDTLNKFQSAPSVDKIVPNASIASMGNVNIPNVPLALPIVPEVTIPGYSISSPPLYSSFNDLGTSNFVLPDTQAELVIAFNTAYSDVNHDGSDGSIVDLTLDDDYSDF